MPDEDKFFKTVKQVGQTLHDKFYDKFSGQQTIKINWNKGGITEIKEMIEKTLK